MEYKTVHILAIEQYSLVKSVFSYSIHLTLYHVTKFVFKGI